jgi:hypothetical protein
MDKKHLPYLEEFIQKLDEFRTLPSEDNFDHFIAVQQKFMQHLFHYHGDLINHEHPVQFMESIIGKRRNSEDFPIVLAELLERNEDKVFLSLCPFAQEVLEIWILTAYGLTTTDFPELFEFNENLKQILNEHKVVRPLQKMVEFTKVAQGKEFNEQIFADDHNMISVLKRFPNMAIAYLGAMTKKHISHPMREEKPYNLIAWKNLEILDNMTFTDSYKTIIEDKLPGINKDLEILEKHLDDIIKYEQTKFGSQSYAVNSDVKLNKIQEIVDVFEDRENLKSIELYLDTIEQLHDNDNLSNRFTVLRILTAIGEASKNLSEVTRSKHPNLFRTLKDIRDNIVHAKERGGVIEQRLNHLTYGNDDRLLQLVVQELPQIRLFIRKLQQNNNNIINDNDIRPLSILESIGSELNGCILAYREQEPLLATLPILSTRIIEEQRQKLSNVLYGIDPLPKNYDKDDGNFTSLCEGLGLSKTKLKDMYAKLAQIQKCTILLEEIDKANNINNDLKTKLETIPNNELKKLITQAPLDHDKIKECLAAHKKNIALKSKEIDTLLEKLPGNEINISKEKIKLKEIISCKSATIEKKDLLTLLDRVGITDKNIIKEWLNALEILKGLKPHALTAVPKKHFDNIYDKIIENITQVTEGIERLKSLTEGNRDNYREFLKNKPLLFACEYAYGLFIKDAIALHKRIKKIKDPEDIRSCSILFSHPYDKLCSRLKHCI